MRVCLQITTGSDVYSFGVLLWTSYTGQHPCMRKGGEWVRNPRFPGFHDCMSADPCHAQYRHLALAPLLLLLLLLLSPLLHPAAAAALHEACP